jgi:hypothetical protein
MIVPAVRVLVVIGMSLACVRPVAPPDPKLPEQNAEAPSFNPSPVRELEIEHTGCFGPCPIYQVRVTDAGELQYEGKRFVRHVGTLTASMYPADVGPLFTWLRDHPTLYQLNAVHRNGEDGEQITYRFRLKSGETVVVESDVVFDGDEFWALSSIVDGMVSRALLRSRDWATEHETRPAT